MLARAVATVVLLVFALGAFFGVGPGGGGPLNLFGIMFLVLAVVTWRCWHMITGDYSAPGFDGMAGRFVNRGGSGDYYRGSDENYRRGEPPSYRESEPRSRRRALRR